MCVCIPSGMILRRETELGLFGEKPGLGSNLCQFMCDWRWTTRSLGRFSPRTAVTYTPHHSTNASIFTSVVSLPSLLANAGMTDIRQPPVLSTSFPIH